jgi:hypothetical protein
LAADSRGGRLDVKLIDFDHTVIKSEKPDLAKSDSGAAYGLRNLIKVRHEKVQLPLCCCMRM